jgi:hypothetical protein
MSPLTGGGPRRAGHAWGRLPPGGRENTVGVSGRVSDHRGGERMTVSGAEASSRRRGWLVPLIVALTLLPGAAGAQPYRWVDEQGGIHITDDLNSIPERHRPRLKQMAPSTENPAARSAGSGQSNAPGPGAVALWLQTGGMRGSEEPILIRVYDNQETCAAERDRRTAASVSQGGMQPTSQPGLAFSNTSRTVVGAGYFAYKCVPAGVPLR